MMGLMAGILSILGMMRPGLMVMAARFATEGITDGWTSHFTCKLEVQRGVRVN